MTFYIQTFGCKVNTYESSWMKEFLESASYVYSDDLNNADIVIINSCTVTSQGDSRVLSFMKRTRKNNNNCILILTGCYPQTHKENLANIDADIIIGTKNRRQITLCIEKFLLRHEKIIEVSDYVSNSKFEEMQVSCFPGHTRAFIKIQDGCNQFCSYCTIPYARGRCRSKSPETLREELKIAAKAGYKEVVFCGINLAFYGIEYGLHLRDAIRIAAETDGIERIRLSSLEPERITDEDIEYLASLEKFCPQFHLSLQSGCTETLKRMNRKYTTDEYKMLVDKIRKAIPDCAITTDVMVGFPGETDEEFNSTKEFIKSIGFSKIHIFRYSRRAGTVADKMKNQVPEAIKSKRAEELSEIAKKLQENYNKSLVGKTFPILFERQNESDFYHGHAPNGVIIKISSKNHKKDLRNLIFYVTIEDSNENFCTGFIPVQD